MGPQHNYAHKGTVKYQKDKNEDYNDGTIIRQIEVKGAFSKYEPIEERMALNPSLDFSNFIQLKAEEKSNGQINEFF